MKSVRPMRKAAVGRNSAGASRTTATSAMRTRPMLIPAQTSAARPKRACREVDGSLACRMWAFGSSVAPSRRRWIRRSIASRLAVFSA